MGKSKKKYYAIAKGRTPGIYNEWYGKEGAESQVRGFTDARFKGFSSLIDAQKWLEQFSDTPQKPKDKTRHKAASSSSRPVLPDVSSKKDGVIIYTDGGCIRNPGPGGYGVLLIYDGHKKSESGGFRLTTNNRMELTACIVGLRLLKFRCSVTLYSDSQYVVNGITKGWATRWRANGWMRNATEVAENADLWSELLDLCKKHRVRFVWVRGHAGTPENEFCDQLATTASQRTDLPPDTAYEKGKTKVALVRKQ